VDLVWKDGFKHGGQNKVAIETTYIPHAHVSEFLRGEQGYANCGQVEHLQEFVPSTKCKNTNDKRSFRTWSKPINPFHWSFLQVLRLVVFVSFDLIE
jgi:hypothetical protein